jgi:ribonuclease HI
MFSNFQKNSKDAKVFPISEYTMNFDGASKGNPGLSGAGAVIYNNNQEEIWCAAKFIGYKTNNQAEYSALILGLQGALKLNIRHLSVLGDSMLVINQVNNIYKVKSDAILELYKEVLHLKAQFDFIEFNHVYREYNKRADELSNIALLDLDPLDSQTDFIKELDEDWLEEPKIDNLIQQNKSTLTVKIHLPTVTVNPKQKTNTNTKNKQLSITQFFKMNPL